MGVAAKKAGKLAVRAANSILNLFVILLVLLLVAYSCYALWDSNQLHEAANSSQYETYKPSIADEGESFAQLRAINPEVFAWLTVYGTHIDYPVTQAEDNWKYVNTNAKGEYSMSGSIFLDCMNRPDFTDFNSILYGHHMERETMFGELDQFAIEATFNERPHGNLYYGGRDHGLEFFAFLHVDAYDSSVFAANVQGGDEQQQYLDNLLDKSIHSRDIGVTTADRIVLLTTCSSSSTNGRDILVARVTDELYDDTFITEETDNTGNARVDAQSDWWAKIPLWGWGILAALLALLLLAFVLMNRKKQKRRRERLMQGPAENGPGGETEPGKPEERGD